MCDTLSITANWSDNNVAYFAKNSDRSPNEPHLVLRKPAANHAAGSMVQCTYINIPQVEYTREMILYKPSWIWGAEMGINENHVAIGNEAVFTRSKQGPPSLIGMDILRLALERAGSAASAVDIMIGLLKKYGQGGNCGFDKEFYYDNSFLAADPREAFVLETSGKNYAVIGVKDRYAISNRLSIGKEHSVRGGVEPGEDFSKRFTEPVFSHFSSAKARRRQVLERLSPSTGASDLMSILRNHNAGVDGSEFTRGSVSSVCMHAGGAIGDHTTGSLVAVLRPDKPLTLWSTGSSTPCISAFKPVFWGSNTAPVFDNSESSVEYWLKREHIHRAVIAGKIDAGTLRGRIRKLESDWLSREAHIMSEDIPNTIALATLSSAAAQQEQALIDEIYNENWRDIGNNGRYARYWKQKNDKLGLPAM